jgi:hypothetical protein
MNLMSSSDMKMRSKDKLNSQEPLEAQRDKACLGALSRASRVFGLALKKNVLVQPKADIKTLKSLVTLTAIDMLMQKKQIPQTNLYKPKWLSMLR